MDTWQVQILIWYKKKTATLIGEIEKVIYSYKKMTDKWETIHFYKITHVKINIPYIKYGKSRLFYLVCCFHYIFQSQTIKKSSRGTEPVALLNVHAHICPHYMPYW